MTHLIVERVGWHLADFATTAARRSAGLALCSGLAAACYLLAQWPWLNNTVPVSPLMLGVLVGVLVRGVVPHLGIFEPGIAWALRYVLRAGIVLLGFRLAFADLVSVGIGGMTLVVVVVCSTLVVGIALGRLLKLPDTLSVLIATGSGICGASAVVAIDGVIRAREQDVVCGVALVTVFGTVAMFVYPLLGHALGLPESAFAAWVGSSIHEVAQVVAAGFTFGGGAGPDASVFKLARVAMLVPACAALAVWWRASNHTAQASGGGAKFPLFILGFVAVVIVNSFLPIDHATHSDLVKLDSALLAVAMVAMGLQTRIMTLIQLGWRPVLLGLATTVWIGVLGLGGAWFLLG
ncbi:putative sulfate exporter family transporter [Salinisphaera sp. USBA-960]|uniref:YeiH family protein n=1 Tax=Salinisphaera orenii TaxID=856731 RepID=UPI0013A625B0|nr:putative sulfate exporter family transporter [Salifodinibacter halophilus]NNC26270.1 putative sulfate exporter family transporter [Salifodinibacter halophilus]